MSSFVIDPTWEAQLCADPEFVGAMDIIGDAGFRILQSRIPQEKAPTHGEDTEDVGPADELTQESEADDLLSSAELIHLRDVPTYEHGGVEKCGGQRLQVGTDHWRFLEFGTRYMRPQPYLRPTLEALGLRRTVVRPL